MWLAYRYLPALAPTPEGEGRASGSWWFLVGAATALAALHIYVMIYDLASSNAVFTGSASISPDADIVINGVESVLLYSGVLLALAALIFFLAPAPEATAGAEVLEPPA